MCVFNYLLSMSAQYYVYPIGYDKTDPLRSCQGTIVSTKNKNWVKLLSGCEIEILALKFDTHRNKTFNFPSNFQLKFHQKQRHGTAI